MRKPHLAAALLMLLLLPTQALGGAWTQKQWGGYERLSFNYFRSVENFDEAGRLVDRPDQGVFEDYNITWYQELGLTDYLSLVTSIPFKYQKFSDVRYLAEGATGARSPFFDAEEVGVGDIEFGLKLRLIEKPLVVSFQFLAKTPDAYDENADVPLGNGQWDFEGRVLLGKSLWPFPGYVGLEAGYRYRTEAPSDEIKYLAELGVGPFFKHLYFRTKLDGTLSAGNATAPSDPRFSWLSNEYDLGKLELTGGLRFFEALDIEFTYTPYLYGSNITAGDTYSVAVAYTF